MWEVRFVESHFTVFKNFAHDLPIIVEFLNGIDVSVCKEKKGLLSRIRSKKFIRTMLAVLDCHVQSKMFSKATQSDEALVLDLKSMTDRYRRGLRRLQTKLGNYSRLRVDELANNKYSYIGEEATHEIEVYASGTGGLRRSGRSQGTLDHLTATSSTAAAQHVSEEDAMLGILKDFAGCMLEHFDDFLSVPDIVPKLITVMDYRQMPPLTLKTTAFQEYGREELYQIIDAKFPYFKHVKDEVHDEALVVREWVFKHKKYLQRESEAFVDKDTGVSYDAKSDLALTGRNSVFGHMFSSSNAFGQPVKRFAHICDYMIAYRINQSDTERIGKILKNVVTPDRSTLLPRNAEVLVCLAKNLPALGDIDYDRFVDEWIRRGHRLPMMKNDGGVMRRKRAQPPKQPALSKSWGCRGPPDLPAKDGSLAAECPDRECLEIST